MSETVTLVTTKPEAEIAADLKTRMAAALKPVCEIMDEGARQGLLIQWDGFLFNAGSFRHATNNLRVIKTY